MSHRKVYSRSGVFAWSGSGISESGIVVAEAAQQIDLFRDSVSSFFDFLSTDDIIQSDSTLPLKPTRTVVADFKFNDLAWAPFLTGEHPAGLIIGCGESGHTSVFGASALQGGSLQCLGVRSYHQGHVVSVSVNAVNPKWVCTGGAMGSVLLWDLNDPLKAVTPGKPNFEHQIRCVNWNRCSEHILGSLTSERCSIWDLRAPGAPALDIADIGGGVEWSTMKWNPFCGTELCIASQNDQTPMLYKWDLRYPSSAVFGYQLHSKGILAMDWCPKDAEIVVTIGKDEQIIFQNPTTQKAVGLMRTTGWARKLSWCNTNPNLFAVSFYDQPVSIYSITPFGPSIQGNEVLEGAHFELSVIPAWLHPGPCGASFSLGNKVCYFSKEYNPYVSSFQSSVSIGKVEGYKPLHYWASKLLSALGTNQLAEYCIEKSDSFTSESDPNIKFIWKFLSVHTVNSSRSAYLAEMDSFLPTVKEENKDLLQGLLAQMNAWSLNSTRDTDSAENSSADSAQIDAVKLNSHEELPIFPSSINTTNKAQDKSNLLNLTCCGCHMEGIAKALLEKNYLFALLLACSTDEQNIVKFVGRTIAFDSSLDAAIRVTALMTAGLWDEIISSWDLENWSSLFRLIISQGPAEHMSSLCRKLATKMHSQGLGLSAAIPAIAGGDVETLLAATQPLPVEERIALANIFRQSLGGGSLRVTSVGPNYIAALNTSVTQLAKEGFVEEAWQLLEPIEAQKCPNELRELKYALYEALGKPPKSIAPEDPYSEVKAIYAQFRTGLTPQSLSTYRFPQQPAQLSGATYLRYPAVSGSMQNQNQPLTNPLPPMSAYAQLPSSGYSSYGYSSPSFSQQNAFPQVPFSQNMQPPSSSQSLYSTGASIPPPPTMMQSSGDTYSSCARRSRTASSSSYSSGHYVQSPQEMPPAPPLSNAPLLGQIQQSALPGRSTPGLGWNDPPPIALKKSPAPAPVAEIKWTPTTINENPPPLMPQENSISAPQQSYSLSESDSCMISALGGVIASIRQADQSPVTVHKTADIEQKISTELIPRLSKLCFSQETVTLLQEFAKYMAAYEFHSCHIVISKLVGGRDFVELSPVMPGLRTLLQLAQKTFGRR